MAKLVRFKKLWVLTAIIDGNKEQFAAYDIYDCFKLYAGRICDASS